MKKQKIPLLIVLVLQQAIWAQFGWFTNNDGYCSAIVSSKIVMEKSTRMPLGIIENAYDLNSEFDNEVNRKCTTLNSNNDMIRKQIIKYHKETWFKIGEKFEPIRNTNVELIQFNKSVSIDTIVSVLKYLDSNYNSEYTVGESEWLFQPFNLRLVSNTLIDNIKRVSAICKMTGTDTVRDCCRNIRPKCKIDTLMLIKFNNFIENAKIKQGVYVGEDSTGYAIPYIEDNIGGCGEGFFVKMIRVKKENVMTFDQKFIINYQNPDVRCISNGSLEEAIIIK